MGGEAYLEGCLHHTRAPAQKQPTYRLSNPHTHPDTSLTRHTPNPLLNLYNRKALARAEAQTEEARARSQALVEQQRRYFQAVRDFQQECGKNEWLVERLEAARAPQ